MTFWPRLRRRFAKALGLGGVVAACGSSSDLTGVEASSGAKTATAPTGGQGAIAIGGASGVGARVGLGGASMCPAMPPSAGSVCTPGGPPCVYSTSSCLCSAGGGWVCQPWAGAATGAGGAGSIYYATGGSAIPPLPGFQILSQGYVVAGTWHGYAWPAAVTSAASEAASTTIDPSSFAAVIAGEPELCVRGSVGAASDYGGAAMLGLNVNQAEFAPDGGAPAVRTLALGGIGITVRYTNPGGSELRVQVQTPAGESSPTGRWCATLTGTGGTETVGWDQFWGGVTDGTQGCWNTGGTHPPVGTQFSNVSLLVPGRNADPVSYAFCLQGIIPV